MPDSPKQKKLLSAREVAEFYGIGNSTLWRWLKLGMIPKPIRIGRRTFWLQETLDGFVTDLVAATDQKNRKPP